MGALLVLLAVAATSVTYGWQPDGTGGVEYLVQVSPDKLAQVRETGEITSTIPPELRGHVSRVVIRVGNAPLPRTVSASMQQSNSASSGRVTLLSNSDMHNADMQSMPIPSMRSGTNTERVMKPQDNFSFPDAATRAGQDLRSGANAAAERLRNSAASTMNDLRENARGAAGEAANDLRNQANDRMTAAARDNQWSLMNDGQRRQPSTEPIRAPNTSAVRPEFIGPTRPSDFRTGATTGRSQYTQAELDRMERDSLNQRDARFANARTSTQESSRRESERGFGPSSNFGMMPAGMGTSGMTTSGMTTSERMTVEEERRRAEVARSGRSDIGFADARLNLGASRTNNERNPVDPRSTFRQERSEFDTRLAADSRATDPRLDPRNNTFNDRDSRASAWPPATNTNPETNLAADRLRERDVDKRLSKADIDRLPTGAWSFDMYGNPIDKQFRVLDRHGNPVSQQRAYELTIGRNNPAVNQPAMGTMPGMPTVAMQPNNGQVVNGQIVNGQANFPGTFAGQGGTTNPGAIVAVGGRSSGTGGQGVNSASDRFEKGFSEETSEAKKRSLAAQPLFNGLLLMSIVGNVYLVFWLKNLRHQFHDLVSSKRVANSDPVGI